MYLDELKGLKSRLKILKFAPRTCETYASCIRGYFEYIKADFRSYSESDLQAFLKRIRQKGGSPNQLRLYLSAIKFYYLKCVGIRGKISIELPKRAVKCRPSILSRGEIRHLRYAVKHPVHRLLLCLAYGAGLRLDELVNLKKADIEWDKKLIKVKGVGVNSERIVPLPRPITTDLWKLVLGRKKTDFVFTSAGGGAYPRRTVQKIFKNAARKYNLSEKATFQSLRHSFAVHLIENGTDLSAVHQLLGNKDLRSTKIYAEMAQAKIEELRSPLRWMQDN